MPQKINPTNNNIVVKMDSVETVSKSGIVLPNLHDAKADTATVLEVGPGRKTEDGILIPVDLKVGDVIVFKQFAGQTVKVGGDEFVILKEDDVIAVMQ